MEHDLTDALDSRLRAARPHTALLDENAFDAELLARVRDQPIAARRTVPRTVALPVAAGVTLTAAAVVMLGGGPGHVGGPSSASAITQALHWLNPSPGTILHARSVETMGTRTTTREFWQAADHPASERLLTEGTHTYETAGGAFYDPATDTIYDATGVPPEGQVTVTGGGAKKPAPVGTPAEGKVSAGSGFVADPIVDKVRTLMADGQMVVSGREIHNGTDAYAISLNPDVGRPVWTLWVSAADGKPLELRDPGRDASEQPQVIRWTTYEVLPDSNANNALLTLTGAHPSAHVSHDPAQATAAMQRLEPPKN